MAEMPVLAARSKRQAYFDRAHARLLEMLIRSGANTEPAVIGDVDDPARPLAAAALTSSGKDRSRNR